MYVRLLLCVRLLLYAVSRASIILIQNISKKNGRSAASWFRSTDDRIIRVCTRVPECHDVEPIHGFYMLSHGTWPTYANLCRVVRDEERIGEQKLTASSSFGAHNSEKSSQSGKRLHLPIWANIAIHLRLANRGIELSGVHVSVNMLLHFLLKTTISSHLLCFVFCFRFRYVNMYSVSVGATPRCISVYSG